MQTQVSLLFPFDLGLELDFTGKEATSLVQEVATHAIPSLNFKGRMIPDVREESHLYRFGVGVIQLKFPMEFDLPRLADISCNVEKIGVGKTAVLDWCQSRVNDLIQRALPLATHRYDLRLKDAEIFPVFILDPAQVKKADQFIRSNYKALYGIVSGEPNFDMLSDFVFQKEPLGNFGYYGNELILLKRFGACVSSDESGTILDLISLSYAQYWSLKAYNFVLDSELDSAQKLLNDLPPYYKFWRMPKQYRKFSQESIDFGKDKLWIVDSLYNVSTNIPQIDLDWHLRTLHKDISQVFNIEELYKMVETKLDHVEESYIQAREFLSTNFFILLDLIFALWLLWGVFDTFLLLHIASK